MSKIVDLKDLPAFAWDGFTIYATDSDSIMAVEAMLRDSREVEDLRVQFQSMRKVVRNELDEAKKIIGALTAKLALVDAERITWKDRYEAAQDTLKATIDHADRELSRAGVT